MLEDHLAIGVVSKSLVCFVNNQALNVLRIQGVTQQVVHHYLGSEEKHPPVAPSLGSLWCSKRAYDENSQLLISITDVSAVNSPVISMVSSNGIPMIL